MSSKNKQKLRLKVKVLLQYKYIQSKPVLSGAASECINTLDFLGTAKHLAHSIIPDVDGESFDEQTARLTAF